MGVHVRGILTKKTRETPIETPIENHIETPIENHIDPTETPVLTLTCVSEEQVPVSSHANQIQT